MKTGVCQIRCPTCNQKYLVFVPVSLLVKEVEPTSPELLRIARVIDREGKTVKEGLKRRFARKYPDLRVIGMEVNEIVQCECGNYFDTVLALQKWPENFEVWSDSEPLHMRLDEFLKELSKEGAARKEERKDGK